MIEHEGRKYELVEGVCRECDLSGQLCRDLLEGCPAGAYEILRLLPEDPQPDLTEFGYADGMYEQRCTTCSKQHMADKRAWNCKECATNLSIRIAEASQTDQSANAGKMVGSKMEHTTDHVAGVGNMIPTIELRGVETDNGIVAQYEKTKEEILEQEDAFQDFISGYRIYDKIIDETWDVIRANITLLEIIARETGIPITEGRDRHLAKMDSRGWKERTEK